MDLDDVFKDEISRSAEKSEDELKKFSIDPNLSAYDRNIKLLTGNDLQKSVACRALGYIYKQLSNEKLKILLNSILAAQEQSKENHQVMFDMSEMIDEFLRIEHPDINEENKKLITDIIFNGIDSNRGQYWGKPLSQYVENSSVASIKLKIPEFQRRSHISASEAGRTAIALCLGSLMLKIEKIPEQMEIMQLSKELSNDVCMEVRKAAASQMDKIIKSLNKKYISEIIAEISFLICEEEEATVVETALNSLPQIVKECSLKNCFAEIIPLLKTILSDDFVSETSEINRILSSVLWNLCEVIQLYPSEYSVLLKLMLNSFSNFATSHCPITASNAIQAIEAITKLQQFETVSNESFLSGISNQKLEQTIETVFKRKDKQVKINVAKYFIHGSVTLPRKKAQRIYIDLWKSLDNEDLSVFQVLAQEAQFMGVNQNDDSSHRLKNMTIEDVDGQSSSALIYQAKGSQNEPEPKFSFSIAAGNELSNHINTAINTHITNGSIQWRTIFYMLRCALRLGLPLQPLVAISKRLIRESPYKPIRFISGELLANQMRLASVADHREILKFLFELITSDSCKDRECFIKLIPILVEIYSKKFFKKHFYSHVLALSGDKVPNIRYQICRILPLIKPMLTLPDDREKLTSLDLTLRNIISYESDRDVRKIMEDVIITMDRIPVRMHRVSNPTDMNEKLKEDHEKQYEEQEKAQVKNRSVGRRNSSTSSLTGSLPRDDSTLTAPRGSLKSRSNKREPNKKATSSPRGK